MRSEQRTGASGSRAVVFALGFVTLVSQTIVLREFLGVFGGNELVIGMALAIWMLLTALGAYAGRTVATFRAVESILFWLLTLLSVLPLVTIFVLHAGRNVAFPYGTAIGPWQGFVAGAILLGPICLTSGALFTLAVRALVAGPGGSAIARAYALEAAGSVAGGVLYNTIGVFFLSTYQALVVLAFGGLVAAGLAGRRLNVGRARLIPALIVVLLALVESRYDLDRLARGHLFPGQRVLLSRDTPHGNLTVTGEGEQKNFFENGTLFFSTGDVIPTEEAVHYAMVQHPRPRTVLLIGGGVAGSALEVLKYGVKRVDYIEVNPALADAGRMFTRSLDDQRIRVIPRDGRLFVKTARERYDVALVNVPEPLTAQLSRYYSAEFLTELKRTLAEGAVVQYSLFPAAEYRGIEARSVSSILVATLRTAFKNVLIVPGARDYYLASDSALSIDVARMIAERGIPTVYVNDNYLDDALNRARSEKLMQGLDPGATAGRDLEPIAYLRTIEYWLSGFGERPWIPGVLMLVLAVVAISRMDAVSLGMFTGGFAASALELVILFGFQVVYGIVFQMLGLLITLFMAGLASGAWVIRRGWVRPGMTRFVGVQLLIALLAVVFALALPAMVGQADYMVVIYVLFGLGIFKLGMLVGAEFALAAGLQSGSPSDVGGSLYGVDLFGSAVGALITAVYVIPLYGLDGACFIVAGLSVLSGVFGILKRGEFPGEVYPRSVA